MAFVPRVLVLAARSAAFALLAALLFAAFVSPTRAHTSPAPLCTGGAVSVSADFERARATSCTISQDRRIEVRIEPETRPINDSAWFAFKVSAQSAGAVHVTLSYSGGTHRYRPKISTDGLSWRAIDAEAITVTPDRATAAFSFESAAGDVWISAQPLETAAQALARWQAHVADGRLLRTEVGRSINAAPLVALATPARATRRTLVLLARQHPPETPGAVAFDAFFERLLEDDALAQGFRADTAILAFPVLNPDGLARGHWRTNAAAVDLNRDWGPFSQPETRAAARAIEHVARTRPIIGVIDFHATRRDVIYAQPANDPLFPMGLSEDWFARWKDRAGGSAPPISRAHDATQANAKTWSRLRFGVSGVTYEVADEADLADVKRLARLSAEAYMDAVAALAPERLSSPSPLATP